MGSVIEIMFFIWMMFYELFAKFWFSFNFAKSFLTFINKPVKTAIAAPVVPVIPKQTDSKVSQKVYI